MDTMERLRDLVETAASRPFVSGIGDKICRHLWLPSNASPVFREWLRQAWRAQFRDACPHCGGTVRVDP